MNRYIGILILVILAAGLPGCHAGRKAARNREVVIPDSTLAAVPDTAVVPPLVSPPPPLPTINVEKEALINSLMPLWNQSLVFQTFSGKAKVHYEGKGEKQDFSANIRIEQDRRIWISITALGLFEVARAMITPDSIQLIDRLHKEVYQLPFSEAGKLMPVSVDFSTLQRLIIGNSLRMSERPTDATDFGGGLSLEVSTPEFRQEITFNKLDSTMRQQQLKSNSAEGPALLIQYGDYTLVESRMFSIQRVIHVQDKGQEQYLDLNFNNVIFDQPLDFAFSIPAKYTRK